MLKHWGIFLAFIYDFNIPFHGSLYNLNKRVAGSSLCYHHVYMADVPASVQRAECCCEPQLSRGEAEPPSTSV